MASLTLTAKQQAVLLVPWPCLKVPPRIDVQIGPEGIRLGATFDRTAPGMVFDKVRSDYDQIAVAANLDVATVEVDFERLEAAAGLGSIEEAVDVWESIKEVVRAAASATPVSCPSRDSSKAENSWDIPKWAPQNVPRPTLLEQLSTAARDIQRSAYKAQQKNIEARLDAAVKAAANVSPSESRQRYTEDRLQVAKK